MKKILIVFGTRPEAIKMAPLVKEFRKYPAVFETFICVTGQHREMLDQVLTLFEITPDFDLDIMKPGQDLYDITSRVLLGMREIIKSINPSFVFVHGDTTTTIATALAAFYQQTAVVHIEAGLRTHNIYSPWPEEMNRLLTSRIATYHFCPTILSKNNLLIENIPESAIQVTGNTVIDALKWVSNKIGTNLEINNALKSEIKNVGYDIDRIHAGQKMVLITGHRRENFGVGFLNICQAIQSLSQKYPSVDFVYPLHLNPNVRVPVEAILGDSIVNGNVFLIPPLEYLPFVYLMSQSYFLLTDSGGIQEEAPGLGKPVLVMRDTTERPEAVEAGTVLLVGANQSKIENAVSNLLEDVEVYLAMSKAHNPYGDGFASKRIVEFFLGNENDKKAEIL